ncbi:MAG: adenylate/guanylate cyclase domain-containing protein [Thermodesulfobacteriota bacterium]
MMTSWQNRTRPCLLIITVICLLAVYADLSGLYDIPERQTIDWRTRLIRKNLPLPPDIAVIIIDEASLNYVNNIAGRWPWPRAIHADLIDALKQWGAKDIVLDVLFTENQNTGVVTGADDSRLAAVTASSGNVFHAVQLVCDDEDEVNKTLLNRDMPEDFLESHAVRLKADAAYSAYNNYYLPLAELYQAAAGVGVVTFDNDQDGVFREERLLFNYKGQYLPGLSLSPLLSRLNAKACALTDDALALPGLTIPLRQGKYYVNMYGRYEDSVYSYGGVLVTIGKLNEGILDDLPVKPEEFDGKTVFVGGAAVGAGDLKHTAVATKTPAVYLHASIFGNMITRDFLRFAPRSVSLVVIFILVILTVLPIFYLKNIFAQVLIPISAVSLYLFAAYKMFEGNTVLPAANPFLSFAGAYILSFTYVGLTAGRDRRKIKNILGQYVSPAMLNDVLKNHKEDYFKAEVGTREELTIFFSDIRGFTTLSEQLREEQVVEILNTYLSRMVNIIFDNEGTLDKFIGDAVVAFWGAPLRHDDDPYRAVKSALAMMEAVKEINQHNRRSDLPELAIGIGINTGSVILGNIGSEKKLDYTIIGDNVNLTSRLEGLTKAYHCGIIISGDTCQHVRDRVLCRLVDYVIVKGKNKPVMIYSVLGHLASADRDALEIAALSEKAFDLYRERRFEEAMAVYREIRKIRPDDFLAAMFMERINGHMTAPPPADWNGAHVLTSK